ncbi:MAG: DUF6538 domain-containing protein [Xanthomonadales bacterium]|nr:DUF6538 domain-containing protein [Xanthomonadales bacterium]
MRLPHHLLRHPSGIYHFRLVVPRDLCAVIGLRVVKRSTGTRDLRQAARSAWAWSSSYARAFDALRRYRMTDPDDDLVRETLKKLRQGDVRPYTYNPQSGAVEVKDEKDHAQLVEFMERHERLIRATAEAAVLSAEAAEREARARAPAPDPELYARMMRNTPPAYEDRVAAEVGALTLRQAIDHWDETAHVGLAASTVKSKRAAVEEFAGFHGDQRLVRDIRKRDASAWVRALLGGGNDDTTTSTKCSHLKMFIQKARAAGHYPDGEEASNPFYKAHVVTKAEKERRHEATGWEPFTLAHLQRMFDPSNLRRSHRPHTRRAMVLGLYTGARVGEVAQIKVDHFKVDGDGVALELQGDFKTNTSRRRIPIHPDLIRLGLMDWVEAKRQAGFDRLFPTVRLDASAGKGSTFTKGCLKLIEILGLEKTVETRKLGFHSFRSTVIQELQACPTVTEERRCVYVGHRFEGHGRGSHKLYMRPWEAKDTRSVVDGITWGRWLNFDGLHALLAEEDSVDDLRAAVEREERRKAERAAALQSNKANRKR